MRIGLPEQTWIDYQPASFGSRALAYITDFLIRWSAAGVLILLLLLLFSQLRGDQLIDWIGSLTGWETDATFVIAFIAVVAFLVEWSYPIYFEVRHDGVTPGKRLFGLRVVNESGLPISWRSSVLRTLLLIVDLMPAVGLVALTSMLLTKRSQRLGDLVGGTLVIYDAEHNRTQSKADKKADAAAQLLPLETYNLLQNYLARREEILEEFRPSAQSKVLQALNPVRASFPPLAAAHPDTVDRWLEQVFRASRPAKKSYQTERQEGPKTASRLLDWAVVERDLESALNALEKLENGPDSSERSLFETAEAYQRLCQRYAYLSTFYPDSQEAKDAARLVRYGRRLIYQRRLETVKESKLPFAERVGSGFNAVRGHVSFSAAVGVSSALICAALVLLNPNLGWHFLTEDVAANLVEGRLWTEQIQGMNAMASSGIMRNNIAVSFAAFALGIAGGIGTLLILLANGALLGGMLAALQPYHMTHRLLEFIVAHGVLELSVIAVAAACGLYLGDALLQPKTLTRAKALQKRGSDVLELLLFSAVCLVPAGITEGYVSPDPSIHPALKALIGALLGGFYWLFLVTAARRARERAVEAGRF